MALRPAPALLRVPPGQSERKEGNKRIKRAKGIIRARILPRRIPKYVIILIKPITCVFCYTELNISPRRKLCKNFSLTQNRLKARFYAFVDQRERMSSHDVMINRFGAPRANILSASAPLRAARLGWSDEARAPDWTWPRHTTGPSRHTDASVDRSLTREASTIRVVIRPGPSRVTARRRAARRGDGASI